MRDEHNLPKLVKLHQKIELLASDFVVFTAPLGSGKPRRTARHGPPAVPRHAQTLVAELVKRLTPPAIATVQRERADSFHMLWLDARKHIER